ncbi:unnamed protein product [Moneuplotes crassus]|uniref:Uncharacterized protein n=1 Tax=Euplotes crassus TaxID=5936 RepID=A0AAD1XXX5_EUPCR|nr:unnamed protein product [Moneuplotes crassus]
MYEVCWYPPEASSTAAYSQSPSLCQGYDLIADRPETTEVTEQERLRKILSLLLKMKSKSSEILVKQGYEMHKEEMYFTPLEAGL